MSYKCTECQRKFITNIHLKAHIDAAHNGIIENKHKGWCTPHGFMDFKEPVSYEYACTEALRIHTLTNG